jgi:hypothetical protein
MSRSADTRERSCVGWSSADRWSLRCSLFHKNITIDFSFLIVVFCIKEVYLQNLFLIIK